MLYQTIVDFYLKSIQSGNILPGEKLPSLRQTSDQFDVSLSTTVEAYRRLELYGYAVVKDRSGYFACLPKLHDEVMTAAKEFKSKISNLSHIDEILDLFGQSQNPDFAPFAIGNPELSKVPYRLLNRNLSKAIKHEPQSHGHYLFGHGLLELRQAISRWIRPWIGMNSPQNILITNGCLEAINLALSVECEPGDLVAIESPCYYGLLHAIHHHKLKALEIKTDPGEGLSPEAFETMARTHKIKVLISSANGQNPLGYTMSDDRKKEILRICEKYEIRLIEDDLYGELCFTKVRPKSYKYFDQNSIVTYCSSFSKFLAPGVRIGWCIPAQKTEKYLRHKLSLNLSTSSLTQYMFYHVLKNEDLLAVGKNFARYYQNNIQIYSSVIQNQLADRVHMTRPTGSYFIWMKVNGLKSIPMFEKAKKHKLTFMPGPLLSATRQFDSYIRISCASEFTEERNHQLQKLCSLLKA